MKKKLISIVLFFAGWAIAIALFFGYRDKMFQLKQANDVIQISTNKLSFYKDKYGIEHTQRQAIEGNYATLKNYYGNLLDSINNRIKIKSNNIKAVAAAGLSSGSDVVLKVDTVYISDSSKDYHFIYSDRWISLSGNIGKDNKLNYKTYDSVVLTTFIKHSGFLGLGKKYTYVDGYSLNPHSSITGLQSVLLTGEKDKRFSFGVQAGYGWNGVKWSSYVGIGIQYSLIKF